MNIQNINQNDINNSKSFDNRMDLNQTGHGLNKKPVLGMRQGFNNRIKLDDINTGG